jgi:hypothetical protein
MRLTSVGTRAARPHVKLNLCEEARVAHRRSTKTLASTQSIFLTSSLSASEHPPHRMLKQFGLDSPIAFVYNLVGCAAQARCLISHAPAQAVLHPVRMAPSLWPLHAGCCAITLARDRGLIFLAGFIRKCGAKVYLLSTCCC